MKLVPSTAAVKSVATDSLKAAMIGGLGIAGGQLLAGNLGSAVGGILAGSVIGGTPGVVIGIVGTLPLLTGFTQGLAGQMSGLVGIGGTGENGAVM